MKIGIDLGGSHIAIGLVDNEKILDLVVYYNDDNKDLKIEDYILSFIINGINIILEKNNLELKDIEFIGIAAPGNIKDGVIIKSPNMKLENFDLKTKLLEKLEHKVKIDVLNDAKCASLAEKRYGALKDYKDSIFLCIGTGIGGAVFMDDKILVPQNGNGFEFGHMIIKKDGEKCNCGSRGCFEAYCSKRKFKSKILKILKLKEPIKAKELIKIINKNKDNKQLEKLIDEYIKNLSIGLSNITNIFEPQAICIGGSLSHYEDLIFDKLKDAFYNGNCLFSNNDTKIINAKFGNEAGMIGATLIGDF